MDPPPSRGGVHHVMSRKIAHAVNARHPRGGLEYIQGSHGVEGRSATALSAFVESLCRKTKSCWDSRSARCSTDSS